MSANNQILVSKSTFKVYHIDVDNYDDYGNKEELGQGKTLEEAMEIAQKEADEWQVEYGIDFIE